MKEKYSGKDNSKLRNFNKIALVSIIEKFGPITLKEISKYSNLSRGTINNIINELIKIGFIVKDSKSVSTGGRKPDLYNLNMDFFYSIGINIGKRKVRAIIINLKGSIILEKVEHYSENHELEDIIPIIFKIIDDIFKDIGDSSKKIIGIGVSFPGTIDNVTGEIYHSPNIGGVGKNLKNLLSRHSGLPVFVENNSNASVLGEWWFGAGKDKEFVLYVFASYGTGSGILIKGEIYRGANHTAADIGHSVVDIDGKQCHCGNYGCVETYTSYKSIVRRFEEYAKRGTPTSLNFYRNNLIGTSSKFEEIINYAKLNDDLSVQVIVETGRLLGIVCSNLVNLYDPNIVILGGGLIEAGDLFFKPFSEMLRNRSKKIVRNKLEIVCSALEPNAATIGAATVVIKDFLKKGVEKNYSILIDETRGD